MRQSIPLDGPHSTWEAERQKARRMQKALLTGAIVVALALAMVVAVLLALLVTREPREVGVVVTPTSSAPVPQSLGIPRPYDNCTTTGTNAGLGWVVYTWDSGEQVKQDWYEDLDFDTRAYAGTDLEIRVAWYCPPR